jgi:hypothetical protein
MARQFQGYARGRGFSSRSPGSGAVSRIQEQGNKTISGLRQQLQSKRQQDQQYIADLDSNFRRGEQIKDEIKSFEDKAFNLKMANIKRNQNQHLENIQREAAKEAETFKQLSQFSESLGKTIVNVQNQVEKAKKDSEFVAFTFPFLQDLTEQDKQNEELLRKGDAVSSSRMKRLVTEDGMPMDAAQKVHQNSPYQKLKDLDSRVAEAARAFTIEATIDNHGPQLALDILRRFDLLNVSPRRLRPAADAYTKVRTGFETSKRKTDAINTSAERLNTAKAQYFNNQTQENRLNVIQTLATHTTDGKTYIPRPEQLKLLYEIHRNPAITDQTRQDFFNQKLIDSNGEELDRTYGEQFKDTRNVELLNNVEKDRRQAVKDREDVVKTEQLDNYLKTRDEIIKLGEGDKIDFETYKPMLDELDVSSDQRNKLHEELYAISNQKVKNDGLIAQADYLLSTGQDISDVARQMSGKQRSKYLDLANKQKVAKKESGIDDKAIRRTVKSALVKALGQQNVGDDKDPTLEIAIEDALVDIGKDTVINAPASSLAQASTLALQQKLKEIQSGSGKYEVKGIGKGNDNKTGNYFSYYSVDGKYFTQVAKANSSEAIRAVRNRPESRKDVFLVLTDDLATIYNAVQNNEGYQLPYALEQIQKAYPDALQLQLNKYADEFGKPRITVPLTYQQVLSARQDDPRAQRFMQQVSTIQEERIIPLISDSSTRMSQTFMSRPVVLKQNFFQMKAQGGPVDMQSGKQYLEGMGFPSRGAAYLAGNIMQESSWNGMRSWGQVKNDGTKRNGGLISWASWANAPARLGAAEAFLGKPIDQATHSEQLDYMEHEMRTQYPEAYAIFSDPNASTPDLIKASKMYWGYGHEGDRYKFAEELL